MSGHLGNWLSALADSQLTPADTERALIHVAGCRQCAAELADARRSRRIVAAVQDVRPDGELTARLLALGRDGVGTPGGFVPPGGPTRQPVSIAERGAGDASFRTGWLAPALGGNGALTGELAPARQGLRAVLGSVTGLSVVAAGLFLLGDRPTVGPAAQSSAVVSAVGSARWSATAATHAVDAGSSTQDYLSWMRDQGWACPTSIPDGWTVTAVRLRDGEGALEVDLSGPLGPVMVTEQQGQLDVAALVNAEQITVAGHSIFRISQTPWHVAWQAGDTVVEVVSEDAHSQPEVVAAFPSTSFDSGVPARLGRGWVTLTSGIFPL